MSHNIVVFGFGEGVHVLDHLKDAGKASVTTVSMHADPEVRDSVGAQFKLSFKGGSNADAEAIYSKFIDYADMIVILSGYDEHNEGAFHLAEAARKKRKPTLGILMPDMEKGKNEHDVALQKRVGSRTDCLVRVNNDAVNALCYLAGRRRKWMVRKHVAGMAMHAAENFDKLPSLEGYYPMREALTHEVKAGMWKINYEFSQRTRGANAPELLRYC